MKNFICKSCGSNSFHMDGDNYVCDYCKSVYLDEEKKSRVPVPKQVERTVVIEREVPARKRGRGCLITMIIVGVLFGIFSMLYAIGSSSGSGGGRTRYSSSSNDATIDDVAGWSVETYQQVVIATKNYDASAEKYTFSDGMNYEDLIKIVGKPTTTTTYSADDYSDEHVTADWDNDIHGDYAHASVSVTYDVNTGMITSKSCYPDIKKK